jgi:peptide/nickel transport system substrate-binding protein
MGSNDGNYQHGGPDGGGRDDGGAQELAPAGSPSRRDFLRMGAVSAGVALVPGVRSMLRAPARRFVLQPERSVPAASGGILSVGQFAEPSNLDPTSNDDMPGLLTYRGVFDTLFIMVPALAGTKAVPMLAEGYEVNSSATQYTLTLRRGVTFHDGTPFNAAALKSYFDRVNNVTAAPKATTQRALLGPYKSSTVKSDYELLVEFPSPNAPFITNLCLENFSIPSPTAVAKYGASFAQHPVGSGPFMFESYTPNQSVVLTRNPKYTWGPHLANLQGPAELDGVTWRIITNLSTQQAALQSGEIQVAENLETSQLVQLGSSYNVYNPVGGGSPWGFDLNMTNPPTDELAVRQAILFATNKAEIIKIAFNSVYPVANSILTSTMLGYDPTNPYPYNPGKANHLLDSAGWKMGGNGTRTRDGKELAIAVLIPSNYGYDTTAELLAAQWQTVGIKATITAKPVPYVFTLFGTNVANMTAFFYFGADPSVLKIFWGGTEPRGNNTAGYNSKQTDDLFLAGLSAQGAARAAIYREINNQIMSAGAYLPIHQEVWSYAAAKSVSGLQFTIADNPIFTGTRLS